MHELIKQLVIFKEDLVKSSNEDKKEKIKNLKEKVQSGTYKPDSNKIAESIINKLLVKECGQWELEKTSPQSKKLKNLNQAKEMVDSYRKDLESESPVLRHKDLQHAESKLSEAKNKYQEEVDNAKRTQKLADIKAAKRKEDNKPLDRKKWHEAMFTSNNGQWQIKKYDLEKRCWEGYEPTPGKKPYEKDSCRPVKKNRRFRSCT